MGIIKVPLILSLNVTAECEQRHLLITFMIIHSDIYISHAFQKRDIGSQIYQVLCKFCEFTEVLQTLTLKFHLDAVSYWVQIMVFIVRVFRFVVNQILNVAPSLAEQPLSREVVEPAIPSASSR